MAGKVYQENFRYNDKAERDVVDKAYSMVPGKYRSTFLRGIVLNACLRIVKKGK